MKNKKTKYLMILVCTIMTFIIVGCSNKKFDNFEIGQTLKIGSEEFWIIDINDKDITAIAKYNLLVGNICESTDNTTFNCNEIDSNEIGYGLQNKDAGNYIEKNNTIQFIGAVTFNKNNHFYWEEYETETLKDEYKNGYIYDKNSDIYQYLSGKNSYESYLKKYIDTISIGLIDYNFVQEIDNTNTVAYLTTNPGYYWTGSVNEIDGSIFGIYKNDFSMGYLPVYTTNSFSWNTHYGVRPTITISKKEASKFLIEK